MKYLKQYTGFKIASYLVFFILILLSIVIAGPAKLSAEAVTNDSSSYKGAESADMPAECPSDYDTLLHKYQAASEKLVYQAGMGERGKLVTEESKNVYEVYNFYKKCLLKSGGISSDREAYQQPLLLNCTAGVEKTDDVLLINMDVREEIAYESLKRVEISIRNIKGREFFRAMNNRSPVCAPIPPNAFGVYTVGEKKQLTLRDVKSSGMEAHVPVKTRYGYLMDGCKTTDDKGILAIHWKIHPEDWQFPDDKGYVFVKIVPKGEKDAPWFQCASFVYKIQQMQQPIHTKSATVKPLICFNVDDCHEADKITLIRFSRQKRKGTMQRWTDDTAYQYQYNEISREAVNITKLPGKMVVLEPGFYQFEYNDVRGDPPAGFYGKSEVFEVDAGNDMVISVRVESAL